MIWWWLMEFKSWWFTNFQLPSHACRPRKSSAVRVNHEPLSFLNATHRRRINKLTRDLSKFIKLFFPPDADGTFYGFIRDSSGFNAPPNVKINHKFKKPLVAINFLNVNHFLINLWWIFSENFPTQLFFFQLNLLLFSIKVF